MNATELVYYMFKDLRDELRYKKEYAESRSEEVAIDRMIDAITETMRPYFRDEMIQDGILFPDGCRVPGR